MKYSGIIKNDICAGEGVCVTFFAQGCPHHCPGCHNPETWDYDGGKEFTQDTLGTIFKAISANGIQRNFCIMGGEPLCPQNQFLTRMLIMNVKEKFPDIKIYLWTGYEFDQIPQFPVLEDVLHLIDVIVDGPFIQEKRDITLPMRGSSNQRVLYRGKDF